VNFRELLVQEIKQNNNAPEQKQQLENRTEPSAFASDNIRSDEMQTPNSSQNTDTDGPNN